LTVRNTITVCTVLNMVYEKRESASAGTSVRGTENQEWV
jgi:hypothetical protein